jgi:hypothetical protein
MVCSICKQSGHNRRTCIKRKLKEAAENVKEGIKEEITDEVQETITEWLVNNFTKEAFAEAIEMGMDCVIPGLGLTVKLARYAAWSYSRSCGA